ncbi:MAG: ribulose-phosphate 3-epimerase [Angelakisella sp.]
MTISPSLLAANFACLGDELEDIKRGGADMLHLDIMDGHFVPNISFGMPVLAALRKVSDLFFDVHIMISKPMRYLEALRASGADLITFHCEAEGDPIDTINAIHAMGCKAGISLSPDTPVEQVLPYIGGVDLVLIMTVVPGFGGQKFRADMMPKVARIAEYARELGRDDLMIQVDGGITRDTIALCAENGANSFVAGSAVFGSGDYKAEIAALRSIAESREEMS